MSLHGLDVVVAAARLYHGPVIGATRPDRVVQQRALTSGSKTAHALKTRADYAVRAARELAFHLGTDASSTWGTLRTNALVSDLEGALLELQRSAQGASMPIQAAVAAANQHFEQFKQIRQSSPSDAGQIGAVKNVENAAASIAKMAVPMSRSSAKSGLLTNIVRRIVSGDDVVGEDDNAPDEAVDDIFEDAALYEATRELMGEEFNWKDLSALAKTGAGPNWIDAAKQKDERDRLERDKNASEKTTRTVLWSTFGIVVAGLVGAGIYFVARKKK